MSGLNHATEDWCRGRKLAAEVRRKTQIKTDRYWTLFQSRNNLAPIRSSKEYANLIHFELVSLVWSQKPAADVMRK
jgi:hypothetical protein